MSVVGFAGHGAIHPDNAVALLNDYFGVTGEDEKGYPVWSEEGEPTLYYFFDKPMTKTDGLSTAFDYSDYADLDFYPVVSVEVLGDPSIKEATGVTTNEEDVVESIPDAVVKYLKGRGTLIVLWGEEDESDPNTEAIVEAALAADIKVLDLTAGMDSISFEDSQKEPEAVEVKEPTRTPSEMTEEPQELTQPQDEAQQTTAPDHLRVDHATPGPVENTMARTLAEGKRSNVAQAGGDADLYVQRYFTLLQESREKSLALTKWQETRFWAGLARPVPETDRVPIPEPEIEQPKKARGRPRSK